MHHCFFTSWEKQNFDYSQGLHGLIFCKGFSIVRWQDSVVPNKQFRMWDNFSSTTGEKIFAKTKAVQILTNLLKDLKSSIIVN